MSETVEIEFRIEDGDNVNVETLWAIKIGDNLYELDNSPFFAYNVSWKDVIEALPGSDGRLEFKKVVKKSGHKTIRVIFDPPVNQSAASKKILDDMVEMGCSFEGANPAYIAVDIPPAVDLLKVREYLTRMKVQWEPGDPNYDLLFPESK